MADRAYMEQHDVQNQIQLALAWIVREKPEFPLRRLAQLLAPECYVGPPCKGVHGGKHELVYPRAPPAAAPEAAPTGEVTADPAASEEGPPSAVSANPEPADDAAAPAEPAEAS